MVIEQSTEVIQMLLEKAKGNRFENVLEKNIDSSTVLLVDRGWILAGNNQVCDMLKMKLEDITGKNVLEFISKEYQSCRYTRPCETNCVIL